MNARDGSDRQLSWHREYRPGPRKRVVVAVKAWAPLLDPDATMPPYYRIVPIAKNQAVRRVELINCRTCGGDKIEICVEPDLAAAKAAALADYDKRLAQQSAASALTYPS